MQTSIQQLSHFCLLLSDINELCHSLPVKSYNFFTAYLHIWPYTKLSIYPWLIPKTNERSDEKLTPTDSEISFNRRQKRSKIRTVVMVAQTREHTGTQWTVHFQWADCNVCFVVVVVVWVFVFFFFFVVLGFELSAYTLSYSTSPFL
jgi:hypothetical protein